MELRKTDNNETLTVEVSGRLDTTTAVELETFLKRELRNQKTLILDLKELEYISSAGLRILLMAQKVMNAQGELIVRNVNEEVKEVLDITGFSDILTIQ